MGRSLGRQLLDVPAARLVGVADPNAAAAKEASEELSAGAFDSADALLADPAVDAVIVASPGGFHRELTELAASRGKHVFVEKPMAVTVADCDAMIAATEKAEVKLMVGQVLRYYPTWWQVLKLVRDGEIGKPWGVTVTRIGGGWSGWPQAWRNSLEMSGGLLLEVNAHEIDFMCQIGGEVTRVYAEADHYGTEDPSDYPNLYFVSLRFASGAVGMLHASTVAAVPDLSGKVQGSEGSLSYSNGFNSGGEIRYCRRDGETQSIPVGSIEVEQPVHRELRLFVDAVLGDKTPPVTGAEGRRNVAVAQAAYESARTGQPVKL
jgi:predicted dehydrogenase